MVTVHIDPARLSVEELDSVSRSLRGLCAECIERTVPASARHPEELSRFLEVLADAVDMAREPRELREQRRALAIDPDSGEWLAGA